MMRIVEEDACGVEDAEMKARAFLPRALIDRKAAKLVEHLIGKSDFTLDKKDQKTLSRLVPGDYTKVGCVEKVRPVDVATVFRFVGERGAKLPAGEYFKRALWGHAFRKYATHPAYLSSISSYWAKECGLDKESALSTMPMDLAKAVTLQQNLFPAHKYRAQYLYCSTDIARQQWKSDSVIPLLRLFPTLGSQCAEDLAASVIVDSEWSKLKLTEDDNPTQEGVVREVRRIVEEAGSLYDSNIDGILNRVEEGVKMCCPQLTEDEIADMSTTASAEKTE
ncbi:hypothetical protein AGDE_05227 [Angomonas deanei]|uniref:Uncharacterized protein n=1 Tax=Angomonas deanei TaxID=59799 RepID=A0A7G2CDS7_9TRYP|nr:hypothetical protein AGDE_05227 [Angomonas deanei]CAD2217976.1 hypothetical protein, conserved [Angomonas deanei]|eukprot:EPY38702.1 hypothetical protein AGDE_05227 [Angomonas deanei]